MERDLITGYEKDIATVLDFLSPANVEIALELLSLPGKIRGYGLVKQKSVHESKIRHAALTLSEKLGREPNDVRAPRCLVSPAPDILPARPAVPI